MADSSQKFIARNRAPRVQIEYDVELYGAEKKVQLPFVMGVMSDLLGKSKESQPAVADRKFLDIDVENFDKRMKSMAPRAAFSVPNTLTGEGNLSIDLTFESMKDFSPGAIASKVDALRPLLEARNQLQTLMAYMDGKSGAEALIEDILKSPALLASLSRQESAPTSEVEAAFAALRNQQPADKEESQSDAVLQRLRDEAPRQEPAETKVDQTLEQLRSTPVQEETTPDLATEVLANLGQTAPMQEDDTSKDQSEAVSQALSSLQQPAADSAPQEEAANVLDDLKAQVPAPEADETDKSAVLADLAFGEGTQEAETTEEDRNDILTGLSQQELPAKQAEDSGTSVLSDLAASAPAAEAAEAAEDLAAVLEALGDVEAPDADPDHAGDELNHILSGLEEVTETTEVESHADILAALPDRSDDEEQTSDPDLEAILGDLPDGPVVETDLTEETAGILSGLAQEQPEEVDAAADLEAILGQLPADESFDTSVGDALEGVEEILQGLPDSTEEEAEQTSVEDILNDLEGAEEAEDLEGSLDDLLADLDLGAADPAADEASIDAALSGLIDAGETPETEEDLDGILGDLISTSDAPEATKEETDLSALLGDLTETAADSAEADAGDALDDILGDLSDLGESAEEDSASAVEDLDSLLADLGDAEADLNELMAEPAADADLDALLSDLGGEEHVGENADQGGNAEGELDALLALEETGAEAAEDAALEALDDLLGDLALEDLEADQEANPKEDLAEPEFAYGTLSAARPDPQRLQRQRFRIALFGDFSGRAVRGAIEIGDALAGRPAIPLDPDTIEDVIEGFATKLVLPIGKEGAGIGVTLKALDDLHPDELYENVDLFAELVSLRRQLESGVTMDHASRTLKSWGDRHAMPVRPPKLRSSGNAVPADRRLSAFQQLIGDAQNSLRQETPVEEMLARIVGPHIHALPDPDLPALQEAVDAALSEAMRLLLHHPEFQSLEAQWRSLDLIARSVDVADDLEVVLYDVSAEEIAADLASQEDLSSTGLVRLLTEEPLDPDLGRGGYSALIGLYGFEETPPHAELLGRIARVAAHVDAPFLAAISSGFLETPKEDRPPLVAQAWDTLRQMPEAGHLGLCSPRFLLRRPYGARSEPINAFAFEEFTETEGLRGMLWGNPVVPVAILLARSFRENGASLRLGSIMSLGGMPYHYVTDRFGDQVALPCTDRNIDLDKIARANDRGFMALSAVKGRDELRLTSFQSLAGGELLGPWTGMPAPEPSPPDPREKTGIAAKNPEPEESASEESLDLDDLGLEDLDLGGEEAGGGELDDLDALLAGFDDEVSDAEDSGAMDAELAALLDDL